MSGDSTGIERVFARVIAARGGDPTLSYTAQLFAHGPKRIGQKLGEEALETVIALVAGEPGAVVRESADLLYHLAVAWAQAGIEPKDVWDELARREASSGLVEKAARKIEPRRPILNQGG
jgi:phosphoribosyl-ATP pyrophosphohydrolase